MLYRREVHCGALSRKSIAVQMGGALPYEYPFFKGLEEAGKAQHDTNGRTIDVQVGGVLLCF